MPVNQSVREADKHSFIHLERKTGRQAGRQVRVRVRVTARDRDGAIKP